MKEKIKNVLKSFFGMKIHLGTVILACVIFAGIGWGVCSYRQVQLYGGKENFSLAQKYLEVKKMIDDYYV
ncbi:MAG: hypothetical protein EOM14_12500, partial [Clostridia bacterium]|nr:hypothetical protein [Clostridia bacterium]